MPAADNLGEGTDCVHQSAAPVSLDIAWSGFLWRGESVTCMDSNPEAHSFTDLGQKISVIRGDVSQFEDVMAAMTAAKPQRVVNLAYIYSALSHQSASPLSTPTA
jgi:hypothetical protein